MRDRAAVREDHVRNCKTGNCGTRAAFVVPTMSRAKPSKVSLIALDMDGTLLHDDKKLSAANADALRRAAENGVHIMLASGRMSTLLFPFEKQLGIPCYLVPWNGAAAATTARSSSSDPSLRCCLYP